MKRATSKLKVYYWFYSIVGKLFSYKKLDETKLVFIFGTGRCGTTLLTQVLQSNKQVYLVKGELNEVIHKNLYPFEKQKLEGGKVSYGIEPQKFSEMSLMSWTKKSKQLTNLLKGVQLLHSNKTIVLKSAMVSLLIPNIVELFPKIKLIHMFRNGIAVVDSLVLKNKNKFLSEGFKEHEVREFYEVYWTKLMSKELEVSSRFKSKTLSLNYETLTQDINTALENLSAFLNLRNEFQFDITKIRTSNKEFKTDNAAMQKVLTQLGYQ
jgi:hypothetical protein